MTDKAWNHLLESVSEERCIICIGPGLYTDESEKRLEQRLAAFLREEAHNLGIRVYDDGWFHYLPHANEIDAWQHIKDFYDKEIPIVRKIMEKLSRLPFHFILNFVPDYHLRDVFECQELSHEFLSYQKNEPFDPSLYSNKKTPTKSKPLIFNILGEHRRRNSLVMTYNDFYSYLESVFEGRSIAPVLKENIWQADYFIFLGMPFDRWYVHMFMRMLQQHENNRRSKKYAANIYLDDESTTITEEQYTMTFVASDIINFVDEFYRRCQDIGLLRTTKKNVRIRLKFDSLEDWIIKNYFDEALNHIVKELEPVKRDEEELFLQANNLIGRLDELRMGQISGTWDERDVRLENNRIRMALLEMIQMIKRKFS